MTSYLEPNEDHITILISFGKPFSQSVFIFFAMGSTDLYIKKYLLRIA